MIKTTEKIAVIGAGVMGSQIAEVLSRVGGFEVRVVDINEEVISKGIKSIADRLDRFFVSKGYMTPEEKEKTMEHICGETSIERAVKDADVVIESVVENLSAKKEIFAKLENHTQWHTILASNTSYQNISEMAFMTKRPEKVVGMHFFNPVATMKLVEVVRGARTSDETINVVCKLARKLGKEPVVCRDSSYGFLANRAYRAMVVEAVQMVWERVAAPEDIDKALKLGYNLPMGPLELGDYTGGWKIMVFSEQDDVREMGHVKGQLHPLIRLMARAGYEKIYDLWKDVLSKI